MNLSQFSHSILAGPLAFHAPAFTPWLAKQEMLAQRIASMPADKQAFEWLANFVNQRQPYEVRDGLAYIHINDVLTTDTTPLDRALGMTDYAQVISELQQAVEDPAVDAIRLNVNSPGGSAIGAPDAADAVFLARQIKPVVSHISTVGASAAIYLIGASSAIITPRSSVVGSIGTISTFLDYSQMLSRIGITAHIYTAEASDLKAAANPYRAPTLEQANFLQSRVDTLNADFIAWMQTHRPNAEATSMRGQWFTGAEALKLGLVDQLGTAADADAAARALAGM